MNWVGLQMLRNDRAKFAAMIVAVSLAVFLMQNQAAILATMLSMTAAQIREAMDQIAADLRFTRIDHLAHLGQGRPHHSKIEQREDHAEPKQLRCKTGSFKLRHGSSPACSSEGRAPGDQR